VNLDEWFASIRDRYANEMQCGRGCTACCHGLFDISLADADSVASGFRKLPPDVQSAVHLKAARLDSAIEPKFLAEDDPRIDEVVENANNPPCPCLGESGECLIYDDRPLACRLEGVPMVDVRDGLFGDWCELNFKDGVSDSAKADLQQDYDAIAAADERRSAEAAETMNLSDHRLVTFIPSVIATAYSKMSATGTTTTS
jgi:Fe-S-cluster containining protein